MDIACPCESMSPKIARLLTSPRIQDVLITVTTALAMRHPTGLKDLVSVRTSDYALKSRNILVLPKVKTTEYGLSLP